MAKEKIATAVVKQELLENGADALAEKVFGVPTIIAQGELFWGVDSLDMLLHFLDNPDCYSDDEMSRIFAIGAVCFSRALGSLEDFLQL